jgi:hypothetical protein
MDISRLNIHIERDLKKKLIHKFEIKPERAQCEVALVFYEHRLSLDQTNRQSNRTCVDGPT